MKQTIITLTSVAIITCSVQAQTVVLADPSFESGFGWSAQNDATFPYASISSGDTWQTPVSGTVVQFAENVNAVSGNNFGITYAGLDLFTQSINIAIAGTYEFSVYANSISGSWVNFGPVGTPGFQPMVNNADFELSIGGSSQTFTETAGDGWNQYTVQANLSAGNHAISIRNLSATSYAIAYDDAAVSAVPEPSSTALVGLGALGFLTRRKK